tara:strand:- start:285 stop:491 length:207 start_codon:yes stop_codon:yes gene_type:complete
MNQAQEQHLLLRKTGVVDFLRDLMEACDDEGELNEDVWDAAIKAARATTDLLGALVVADMNARKEVDA